MRYIIVTVDNNLAGELEYVLIVDTAINKAIAKCESTAVAGPIRDALNAS